MEVSMSAAERLEGLQAKLVARGVQDVKFYFPLSSETSVSKLAASVADVLEAVENGRVRKIASFAELAR